MSLTHFSYELHNDLEKPTARIEIFYPPGNGSAPHFPEKPDSQGEKKTGGNGSMLVLHLPENQPADKRKFILGEYQKLAKVLGSQGEVNGDNTSLVIYMGEEKSPGGLGMLVIRDLEDQGMISHSDQARSIQAILTHEEQMRGGAVETPSHMQAARLAGVELLLAGAQHKPETHASEPVSENAVHGLGKGKSPFQLS